MYLPIFNFLDTGQQPQARILNDSELLSPRENENKRGSSCYWYMLQSAKSQLLKLSERMRALDEEAGLVHSAIADLLLLYGNTNHWFQAIRDYKVRL